MELRVLRHAGSDLIFIDFCPFKRAPAGSTAFVRGEITNELIDKSARLINKTGRKVIKGGYRWIFFRGKMGMCVNVGAEAQYNR